MLILQDEIKPSPELIRERVTQIVDFQRLIDPNSVAEIDAEALIRQVEADLNVWVGRPTTLTDPKGHEEWLLGSISDIEWNFWDRYRNYLLNAKYFPPESVRKLDEITNDILRQIENPKRTGRWDRRGMVVGQVQSGKTANYMGLICKAVDAGYKLVVVLAGSHNSLRSQTQLRLDEGFLGYDTQKGRNLDQSGILVGVGALPGAPQLIAHSVTSSLDKGDFTLKAARTVSNMFGGDPFLLVIKKNQSILKNVTKWATSIQQKKDPLTGEPIVENIPLLVIDDEADSASINTRPTVLGEDGKPDPDYDPSRINGQIRLLLKSFGQSAYLGYTATPFANIFINSDEDKQGGRFGEDLFPRSFIINLPAPSNYMGPVEVFGLGDATPDGLERQDGLPIVRLLDDYANWMPDRHKQDHRPAPADFPGSLREAMEAFILTCAARRARGDGNEHNSMLIHVTRFNKVQQIVAEQVADYLSQLRDSVRYGDGDSTDSVLGRLRELWNRDFVPTSRSMADTGALLTSWEEVEASIRQSTDKIEVRTINGTAGEALTYYENRKEGLSVIAVGGDKLSRGLTLEGLSVSYYLRASKMYDTLMQMGRWFGYRPDYGDLCRLYTTGELLGWYQDITIASEELRREFDHMADQNATPADYGLRVRSHPGGLMVTAATKMRDAETVRISFSGTVNETVMFRVDPATLANNIDATLSLLTSLQGEQSGKPLDNNNGWKWQTRDAIEILRFLSTYRTHPDARKVRADVLASYIQQRNSHGELLNWTVGLFGGSEGRRWPSIAPVKLVKRSQKVREGDEYRIGRLLSPVDEMLDVPEAPQQPGGQLPSGETIRELRPSTSGLLLLYPLIHPDVADPEDDSLPPVIGMGISFPYSASPSAVVDYVVNNIYYQQEFADL